MFYQEILSSLSGFGQQVLAVLPRLGKALILIIVGAFIIRILVMIIGRLIHYIPMSIGLREILVILSRAILAVLLGVGVLQIIGLSNVAFAVSGFVAAIAIGVSQGFTMTVSDLVSGLQLAGDHDFRVGDRVKAGDKDIRIEGYIVEMDTKKTRIIDKEGYLHVIPNSVVDRNEWMLLERDEARYERMHRDDIIKIIHTKLKKGAKK